mmetsp:Transcript_56555/g.183856  ORF Transcript_56555/g.183856 Transcript_56555/m.183856 type:complete len:234 (+) Transcript_56555:1952-2653(+)
MPATGGDPRVASWDRRHGGRGAAGNHRHGLLLRARFPVAASFLGPGRGGAPSASGVCRRGGRGGGCAGAAGSWDTNCAHLWGRWRQRSRGPQRQRLRCRGVLPGLPGFCRGAATAAPDAAAVAPAAPVAGARTSAAGVGRGAGPAVALHGGRRPAPGPAAAAGHAPGGVRGASGRLQRAAGARGRALRGSEELLRGPRGLRYTRLLPFSSESAPSAESLGCGCCRHQPRRWRE